jgi:hypothetical protein
MRSIIIGLLAFVSMAAMAAAYSASIQSATSAPNGGVCFNIEICWSDGESQPVDPTADGWEIDLGGAPDPDDPCGSAPGTPTSGVYSKGDMLCQMFQFCFPNGHYEIGNEEYQAVVHINGTATTTPVHSTNVG